MRGSPLLLTGFIALGLLLAGIPMWSLTRPHAHEASLSSQTTPIATRPLELKVTSTGNAMIELRQAGHLMWQSASPAETFEQTLSATASTAEFVATVRWLDASRQNAARLQFSRDGELLADTTLWGEEQVEDVITLPAAP